MPSPTRRALLRAGATACPVALAGCSLLESPERHYVDAYNVRDGTHRVEITVRSHAETLFEESYTIHPGKGRTARSFEGTPEEVAVRVDGERPATVDWAPETNEQFRELHPNGCAERTTATLRVYVAPQGEYDDTGLDASTDRGVYYAYGCETVTD